MIAAPIPSLVVGGVPITNAPMASEPSVSPGATSPTSAGDARRAAVWTSECPIAVGTSASPMTDQTALEGASPARIASGMAIGKSTIDATA